MSEITFLSNYLCNKLMSDFPRWLEALFMALHILEHDRMQLLINTQVESGIELAKQVKLALKLLGEEAVFIPILIPTQKPQTSRNPRIVKKLRWQHHNTIHQILHH